MKFFRFLLVGSCSAVVQFLVLSLCLHILGLVYFSAAIVAYIISVCVHYVSNRYFTFQARGRPEIKEVMRYLTVVFINFLVTLFVTAFAVEKLQLNVYIATVLSIMSTVGVAFFVNKHWVFSNEDQYE